MSDPPWLMPIMQQDTALRHSGAAEEWTEKDKNMNQVPGGWFSVYEHGPWSGVGTADIYSAVRLRQ